MRQEWAALQEEYPAERIGFAQADGGKLPVRASTVDQLVAVNILGGGVDDHGVLRRIILETDRVLKLDGEAVFYDCITPRFVGQWAMAQWLNEQRLPRFSTLLVQPDSPGNGYIKTLGAYGLSDRRNECLAGPDAVTIWVMRRPLKYPSHTKNRAVWPG
jgi:hypothetical protein